MQKIRIYFGLGPAAGAAKSNREHGNSQGKHYRMAPGCKNISLNTHNIVYLVINHKI